MRSPSRPVALFVAATLTAAALTEEMTAATIRVGRIGSASSPVTSSQMPETTAHEATSRPRRARV